MILDFKTTKRDACQWIEEKRTWRYFQLDCVGRCKVCLLVMTDAKGAVTRKKMDIITFPGTNVNRRADIPSQLNFACE